MLALDDAAFLLVASPMGYEPSNTTRLYCRGDESGPKKEIPETP